ncbi:MAG: M20/M25/M40 family metallo-hydrolase [Planctomycetota bacterium]|jgi:hypothetical protein
MVPKPTHLLLGAAATACLLCVLTSSCSSVSYREEIASATATTSAENLERHLIALTSLGPRRAGDAATGEKTVRYLEQELQALGVSFERETFRLHPGSRLVLLLETEEGPDERMDLPGVYFGRNIGQARVVRGFAEAAGVADRFDGYALEGARAQDVEQVNLIATIPGTESPEAVLELSAHHDTVPGTVGADDNTSGVAALLEVARLLQENPPACTVRLCFFAAEEIGLLGSREHVRRMLEQGTIDQVFALINLDTVGHYTEEPGTQFSPARIPLVIWPPKTGNFLTVIGANGSSSLGHLIMDVGELYAPELPLYSLARLGGFFPDARRSDHAHYWDLDIPAIFLTDTGEFRSDHYHRPEDDMDGVDVEKLRLVAITVAAAAWEATVLDKD